ncbi:uncharacterized protein LOC124642049 [Helicoverpa zea]|uniref:uncharacterized protein LOC124642049 n=1 Tax=Helicoverpa zea TaxID=7113 RepID=UPI001F5772C1|nr:uncharacterized protein LOC124642049 [Helicoverpa zea]
MSSKKPKCAKVKNPCKFCLQQVTNKNGLQCQGACKKWAHFKCLHYTPGKIADIKAGIIKVTCPCPDCDTKQKKEFLTNPPFSCKSNECPANRPQKCDSAECPSKLRQRKTDRFVCKKPNCSTSTREIDEMADAVDSPVTVYPSSPSPRDSYPDISTIPSPSPSLSPKRRQSPKGRFFSRKRGKKNDGKSPSCGSCSTRTSQNSVRRADQKPSCDSTRSPRNQQSMVTALQEMCGTVGQLSVQLRDLMCKIMDTS